MTIELLSGIVGVVLSLVFSYVPNLKSLFDKLPSDQKRLVMLGSVCLVSLALFGLACSPLAADLGIPLGCSKSDAISLLRITLAMLVLNQTAYSVSPRKSEPIVG